MLDRLPRPLLTLFAASPALCLAGDQEAFTVDYTRRAEVAVVVTQRLELATTAFGVVVDGEAREGRNGGGESEFRARVAWTDAWLADDGARPTELRRSFGPVEGTSVARIGPEPTESELESPFDGAVLRYTVGPDGPQVEVEEGEVEAEAAAALALTLPLDGLLREGAVEPGASWTVEGAALLAALGLDVHETLFPAGEAAPRGGEGGRGGGRRGGFGVRTAISPSAILADLDWTVELTFGEVDADGVAVIAVEAEGEGEPPAPPTFGGGRGGGSTDVTGSVRAVLEGELRFAVAARLPLGLELEGDLSIERETTRTMGERELVTTQSQEGELAFEVTLELLGSDD